MSRLNIALIGLLVVAGLFLAVTRWTQASAFLPYLFLLACPFLHLFMMRGLGHAHDKKADKETLANDSSSSPHHHV